MLLTCTACVAAVTWVGSMWTLKTLTKNTKSVTTPHSMLRGWLLRGFSLWFPPIEHLRVPHCACPGKSVLEMAKLEKITRESEVQGEL
jgi:hypothetical protein